MKPWLRRPDQRRTLSRDLPFVALIVMSLALAVVAVRESRQMHGASPVRQTTHKIDLEKVRQQMDRGTLSPRKALFNKRTPSWNP